MHVVRSIPSLRLATVAAPGAACVGILVLIWAVGWVIVRGIVATGMAFLTTTITISSDIQLLSTGVIREILARIHTRTMDLLFNFVEHVVEEISGEVVDEVVDERTGQADARHEGGRR